MSRGIKFKDNTYLDSSGVIHKDASNNRSSLKDILNIIKIRQTLGMSSTSLLNTSDNVMMSYTIPSSVITTIKVLIIYVSDINVNAYGTGCNISINVGGTDKSRNYAGLPSSGGVWGHHISSFAMENVTGGTVINFKAQRDNNTATVTVTDRTKAFIIEL